ncbi:MAG: helix-turn-helix domain-containing protein [Anaerolineae bacterium]|nr:MAG: helix-turn-helix domain-containing protein [Anaerolineae bacterium]
MEEYLRRYLKRGAKSGRIINLSTDAAHVHTANLSYRLAHDIGVHPRRINGIVHGARAVSADTALRLSRDFGSSERYWPPQ